MGGRKRLAPVLRASAVLALWWHARSHPLRAAVWQNKENHYVLTCQVFVNDGATITIESGTTIYATPSDG